MVENQLDIGGAVVFWTLAEASDRDRLHTEFARLGLAEFVPDPRLPSAVLRDALEETLGGPRVLVRPLATRDGFAVVVEDRGARENAYATTLVARVEGDPPTIDFEPIDDRASRILMSYRKHAARIPAHQLSATLVKVVESLGGTRLRPSGAVYWIPGHRLDEFAQVAMAMEAAADGRPSAVYLLRRRLDADAVRAVRDAVVTEVAADAARIQEEVATGELGARALETRKKQAAELRNKVLHYEDVLAVGLAGLHRAIDQADQAAATAALLLAASPAAELVGEAREMFKAFVPDGDLGAFAAGLKADVAKNFTETMKLLRDEAFQHLLVNYPWAKRGFVVARETQDEVSSRWLIRDGTGKEHRPDDYLKLFTQYVRDNPDQVEAIRILFDRPRDWGTDALGELRRKLAATKQRFTEENLRKAHESHYNKPLVDIISMVKHAASDDAPLLTAEERVDGAIARLFAGKSLSADEQRWLTRIREHLVANLTIDRDDFDDVPVLAREGGWGQANKVFDGKLESLLRELNEAIAA